MQSDAKVDVFIAKAQPFARPILQHIRDLIHDTVPECTEAIKWGMPHFVLEDKNLAGMGAFKAHCSFIVEGAGDSGGDGMGHFGKIASIADLPNEQLLRELLLGRAARIRSGEKKVSAKKAPKPELPIPDDFAAALTPESRAVLDGFTPSQRREYVDWIVEAKRPETRAKRISEAAALLAEGKKRYWKYDNC